MGSLEISHDILIAGSDFESCRHRVERFFDRTMLIRYDEVQVIESESICAVEKDFGARLQEGLAANRQVLEEFLENLKKEGFTALDDITDLEKGYLSKILHLIAHLQDGFIGIDSRFYNLEEDSHWVSKNLQKEIDAIPESYWVVRLMGKIASTSQDPLDALRTFEGKNRKGD